MNKLMTSEEYIDAWNLNAKQHFAVVSMDANESAIEATQKLIAEHDYIPVEDCAKLIQADIVYDYKKVKDELASNPCDVILLCNPGGSPKTNLTKQVCK